MGCGIHCFVERRHKHGDWEIVPFTMMGMEKFPNIIEYDEYHTDMDKLTWPIERNYFLFAILAGVRNYWTSITDGTVVKPIAEGRGLPPDVSDKIKELHESLDRDAYSATWVDISDIKSYDWLRLRIVEDGFTEKEFKSYLNNGTHEWEKIFAPANEITDLLNEEQKGKCSELWMEYLNRLEKCVYAIPHSASCVQFLNVIYPAMQNLKYKDSDDHDIRLVMWFDN